MNTEHYAAWADKKDGTACIKDDPYLAPYAEALRYRFAKYKQLKSAIDESEGGLKQFSSSYQNMGIHVVEGGIEYREWAPSANAMYIFGDFNDWNRTAYPLQKSQFGIWKCFIPNTPDGKCPIKHSTRVKVSVVTENGETRDRNPAWATFCMQDPHTYLFDTVFWNPSEQHKYKWKAPAHVKRPHSLRIYECHVGMGSIEPKVALYTEFADNVLPRIKRIGYTAIQIMAIMEHAYYGSFGYHVTNFFAISSRSGTPEDLKYLIDKAHQLGLYVLMDVVHSHASSNSMDGINQFDGSDHQYFHEGERGHHSLWDSRLFNYGNWEVLRFLLSNLRWYVEEYHFDGFRFDGITSMLYLHSGIGVQFSGNYDEYFGMQVDIDACVYMMLANEMLHTLYPDVATTIAEDVSGMPTLCIPTELGGLGFDYRLAMAIPDMWIELLEKEKDENWNMGRICFTLTNRRWNEKTIGYAESHDQALVGDKTIAFWLMDASMYDQMSCNGYPSPVVERGIALHKMIRMTSFCLSGEGYLTFMGNEFGHPEWIDFPREGNNYSYHLARRRWDLADDDTLRYKHMLEFERLMHELESTHPFCRPAVHQYVVLASEDDKLLVAEKGDRLLFVFNFHPKNSYTDYRIGTFWAGRYKVVLDSDCQSTGGHGRIDHDVIHVSTPQPWHDRPNYLQVYSPARTVQVYHCFDPVEDDKKDNNTQPTVTLSEKLAQTQQQQQHQTTPKANNVQDAQVEELASNAMSNIKLNGV